MRGRVSHASTVTPVPTKRPWNMLKMKRLWTEQQDKRRVLREREKAHYFSSGLQRQREMIGCRQVNETN